MFETDPFPGKSKILFIGLAESTHTHAWIDLLQGAELNVRLFAMPTGGYPPEHWKIRTYLPATHYPKGFDQDIYQCLYPTPEEFQKIEKRCQEAEKRRQEAEKRNSFLKLQHLFREGLFINPYKQGFIRTLRAFLVLVLLLPLAFIWSFRRIVERKAESAEPGIEALLQPKAPSPEAWLAQIIQEWQPDIIHTLGFYDNQGGMFYYTVRQSFHLENYGKWVLQLRGGSDLTLRRHDPELSSQIPQILKECDQIISDNRANIGYAAEMGVSAEKFANLTPVPGTGGIDVDSLRATWDKFPSHRQRMILWPKAYDCLWSMALPVFEAIKIAWENVKPCKMHMLAMTPETYKWYNTLPGEIRQHCFIHKTRIPRDEVLALMSQARVLLAPSLVDGIPNSLYEAMACGAFPIVSSLETIVPVVEQEKNVLFARNLYPHEIADALIRAMNDDELIDTAALNNVELVRIIADRKKIAQKVVAYYQHLS